MTAPRSIEDKGGLPLVVSVRPDGSVLLMRSPPLAEIDMTAEEVDRLKSALWRAGSRKPLPKVYQPFADEAVRRVAMGERPGQADIRYALGWSRGRARAAYLAMRRHGLWTWRADLGQRTKPQIVADPGDCHDCGRPIERRANGKLQRYRLPDGWRCQLCYQDEKKLRRAEVRRVKRAEAEKARALAALAAKKKNPTPRPARPD